MNPEQACHIIEQLALGTDPRTGEALQESDACTAPEVIRALFIARNALRAGPPARPARSAPVMRNGVVLPNAGKRWSVEDADALLQQFEAGTPLGDIAARLGRTDGSIVSRLVHAGMLPDREAGYALIRESRERPA